MKRCPRCEETKPLGEFYPRRRWPDGSVRTTNAYCKACYAARGREERAAKPEAKRASNRRYRENRTPEQRERDLAYKRARQKRYRESLSPEKRAARRERERRANMTPERVEKVREAQRAYIRRLTPEQRVQRNLVKRESLMRKGAKVGARTKTPGTAARLPVEPFRDWLRGLGASHRAIALATGLHPEVVRNAMRRESFVSLDTVDRATLHVGVPLCALYPDF